MYNCQICDYFTPINKNFIKHIQSIKHQTNEYLSSLKKEGKKTKKPTFICNMCNKSYNHGSSLSRHLKECSVVSNYDTNTNKDINFLTLKLELEKLKNENEMLKKDVNKMKIQNLKTKLKMMEKAQTELQLQQINTNNNTINTINNNINNTTVNNNNNIKISKIQYLNINFSNVLDMNTFLQNYKNNYSLNSDQTKILLENFENNGINSCISDIIHYLKKSAVQQYKEIKGQDIDINNIILPFLLSDKYVREHFEKSTDNTWDKTTAIDNIKKIVSITNDQIFKHHNKYLSLNGSQRKRLINGILKASAYSILSQITIPDFYKIKEDVLTDDDVIDDEHPAEIEDNNANKNVLTNNEKDDDEEDDGEEDDGEEDDEENI